MTMKYAYIIKPCVTEDLCEALHITPEDLAFICEKLVSRLTMFRAVSP